MSKYFTLDNFNLTNKVVAIRIDLETPTIDKKLVKIKNITRSMRTARDLLKQGVKVILVGSRDKNKLNQTSLIDHLELLEDEVKPDIAFCSDFNIKTIKKQLNNYDIILTENIRTLSEEDSWKFMDELKKEIDYYILENFSLAHKKSDSTSEIMNIPYIAGRTLEKELAHLNKIDALQHPKVFVLGGNKIKELLDLIVISIQKKNVDKFILTGVLGELALIARGYDLGKKQKTLKKLGLLEDLDELSLMLKEHPDLFLFPSDLAYYDGKERIEISVRDLDLHVKDLEKYEIQDIGMKSIDLFEPILEEAKSIFIKGTPGTFEKEHFEKGSKELIRIITKSKAYTYSCGNQMAYALKLFNMYKEFTYISTAGNSLLQFLSSKKLPGLENLYENFKEHNQGELDFIVVGSNTMDIKVDVAQKLSSFEIGSKIRVDDNFKFNTGGGGVNVSITMSKIGEKIGYLGKISTENKELLVKTLEDFEISLLPTKETKRACAKSILLQTEDSDRVILTHRGHNSYFRFEDVEIETLKSNNFYFTSLNDEALVAEIELAQKIKEINPNSKICFNPSSHALKEEKIMDLISLTDVLIFNFDEAKELTGERDIEECLKKVKELGVGVVVITDGVHGTYAYNGNKQYYQKAKEAKKVVDTTGAGDCFAATFFYFYAKGYGIGSSLIYASLNASHLITKTGTQNGILEYNELVKRKIV